jgi:hypothetical protein
MTASDVFIRVTRIRRHFAIYFCLHRKHYDEKHCRRSTAILATSCPKISVKNYMSAKIDGAIGFIDRLDESCPNSLWRTTGVEPESGDASAWE